MTLSPHPVIHHPFFFQFTGADVYIRHAMLLLISFVGLCFFFFLLMQLAQGPDGTKLDRQQETVVCHCSFNTHKQQKQQHPKPLKLQHNNTAWEEDMTQGRSMDEEIEALRQRMREFVAAVRARRQGGDAGGAPDGGAPDGGAAQGDGTTGDAQPAAEATAEEAQDGMPLSRRRCLLGPASVFCVGCLFFNAYSSTPVLHRQCFNADASLPILNCLCFTAYASTPVVQTYASPPMLQRLCFNVPTSGAAPSAESSPGLFGRMMSQVAALRRRPRSGGSPEAGTTEMASMTPAANEEPAAVRGWYGCNNR